MDVWVLPGSLQALVSGQELELGAGSAGRPLAKDQRREKLDGKSEPRERQRERERRRKGHTMGWRTEGRVGRENGVDPRVRNQEGTGWA